MDHICFIMYATSTMGMPNLKNKLVCMTVDSTYNSFIEGTFKDRRSFILLGHECRENGGRKPSLQYKENINDFLSYYIISCFKQL